jgi:Fe-Mn family superoxide dismutase
MTDNSTILPKEPAMSEQEFDRRDLLKAGALLTAGAALLETTGAAGQGAPASGGTVVGGTSLAPQALPLPFDPAAVPGLSERLLVSHHDNNYVGAVNRLGAIGNQLAALDPATASNFTLNGLKREELVAWNSMILHEIYFAGLGAPNRPGASLASAIEHDFGSEARWRSEFVSMGKALGGGSGWVVLTYSARDRRLVNQWAADHTMALAGAAPVLVLDMYEHAYAMDFGARAGAYVDAFMGALNWTSADSRFERAAG